MNRPKNWLRALIGLGLLVGGAAALIYRRELHLLEIQDWLDDYGSFGPLAFVAAHLLASLFFVPRTVMAIVAGVLFGLWWGAVWSLLGALIGAAVSFLAARYVNANAIQPEDMRAIGPWLKRAEAGGWRAVAIARLIPVVPHTAINYALGVTRIPFRAYLLGTLVGIAPTTIVFANLGATGRHAAMGGSDWIEPTLWGLAFVVLSIVIPKLFKRRAP